jgi:hypothetical protein
VHPFLQICLCDLLLWAHIYCCISQFDKIICLRNTNEVYTIKKPAVFFYHSRWSDYLARYYRNVMFVVLEYFIPCFVLFCFGFFFLFVFRFIFVLFCLCLWKLTQKRPFCFLNRPGVDVFDVWVYTHIYKNIV